MWGCVFKQVHRVSCIVTTAWVHLTSECLLSIYIREKPNVYDHLNLGFNCMFHVTQRFWGSGSTEGLILPTRLEEMGHSLDFSWMPGTDADKPLTP